MSIAIDCINIGIASLDRTYFLCIQSFRSLEEHFG